MYSKLNINSSYDYILQKINNSPGTKYYKTFVGGGVVQLSEKNPHSHILGNATVGALLLNQDLHSLRVIGAEISAQIGAGTTSGTVDVSKYNRRENFVTRRDWNGRGTSY